MSTWYPPPSKPRPVAGGIKARTARGEIGSSWWSRRFLHVLESFAMGNRLTRGRSYARKGQVISLDVAPGQVRASVQGSRARPYRVTIGLPTFPEIVWAKAEIALSEQALPSAKLLAGEVPPELEELFAAAGAPLFPRSAKELQQYCSCPDYEVPCKHLAATFYLLAEAFDTDPFLVLRWRGREKEPLLARLRELRGDGGFAADQPRPGSTVVPAPAAAGTALALADLPTPTGEMDRFWQPRAPLPPRPPVLAVAPDLLLRQLPEPGAALGGAPLSVRLHAAYASFAGAVAADTPPAGRPGRPGRSGRSGRSAG